MADLLNQPSLSHAPLCPPLSHRPRADKPNKVGGDLSEGPELRATVIAVLPTPTFSP